MADLMTFPNTVDKFMEQYKIVDTDEVYTNGAELVPIFRMKQWFDAHSDVVEVVRCKDCKYAKYKANKTWIIECVKDADYDEETKLWYGFTAYHAPDYFCATGERKDGGKQER